MEIVVSLIGMIVTNPFVQAQAVSGLMWVKAAFFSGAVIYSMTDKTVMISDWISINQEIWS